MFNNLGAIGNYTAPGAFRGQTYNTYTGGSIFLRSPNKVYQLATIQFPYVKAGCGGIDVFGGSFSHLSAAEFKNMLKSITAALPGVAFQLALSAVTPLLGQKAEWAKSLETFITNARINSCETATALVRGAANQVGFDAFSSCVRNRDRARPGTRRRRRPSTLPQLSRRHAGRRRCERQCRRPCHGSLHRQLDLASAEAGEQHRRHRA